jgi:hypothetical protein
MRLRRAHQAGRSGADDDDVEVLHQRGIEGPLRTGLRR